MDNDFIGKIFGYWTVIGLSEKKTKNRQRYLIVKCKCGTIHEVRLDNQQNSYNRSKSKNTTSKFVGVSWCKHAKKWRAMINHNYKTNHIGYYNNEELAAKEYNKKALELFGEFAELNIIK